MTARGTAAGLAAAALFGAGVPLSKLLLPSLHPLVLSALLYLGAGLAATAARALRGLPTEAPLRRSDLPALLGLILVGGLLGTTLMLYGLFRLSGVAGALLLNLETPFTVLLAVLFFRDHLGLRSGLAAALVLAGAILLSFEPGELRASLAGVLAISAACLCWALDNNLSQRLSARDPLQVVQVKALAVGVFALAWPVLARAPLPRVAPIAAGLGLGALSYGASMILNFRALRELGAARQATLFATAPFLGALLSIPILGEQPRPLHALVAPLMAIGLWLLLRERHGHTHTHEAL
ncbi:MAG TPA: DMT family transporter, partial [Myxococcales bacterium]|nr:DMT family transporter [Myxococcales bacterium]